jgi:hypothetical protein
MGNPGGLCEMRWKQETGSHVLKSVSQAPIFQVACGGPQFRAAGVHSLGRVRYAGRKLTRTGCQPVNAHAYSRALYCVHTCSQANTRDHGSRANSTTFWVRYSLISLDLSHTRVATPRGPSISSKAKQLRRRSRPAAPSCLAYGWIFLPITHRLYAL